jgi:hypothetical protein
MTCPHCTGSRWLADNRDFGPCVCCTPDVFADLEATLGEVEAELAQLNEQITLRVAAETKEIRGELDDAEANLEWCADHLARYFRRWGIGPVTIFDPDLAELADVLLP